MESGKANAQVDEWLLRLSAALASRDLHAATDLFVENGCYWRDLVTFTWNIITLEGRSQIYSMLEFGLEQANPTGWKRDGDATYSDVNGTISAWFTFSTNVAIGKGHLTLVQGNKCWKFLTAIVELKNYPESTGRNRPIGAEYGASRQRKSWLDKKQEEEASLGYSVQPYCVIVGGGQAGIILGARFKHLGVPTIILEKNGRAGDSWRNRYKSLSLHDPVWCHHLPYVPFPAGWPVFPSKDKLADWLEMYTKVMELNYWSSSECIAARYDEVKHEWEVKVQRNGKEMVFLRPKQLVLATGMSGFPKVPTFPGMESFKGEIYHSTAHRDSSKYRNKRAVVVGSNNSAHDIAADLWENGAQEVTMVQRSSSCIVKSEVVVQGMAEQMFSESAIEAGISTEKADLMFASTPFRLMAQFGQIATEQMRKQYADFYDQLRATGFVLDFAEDGSGLHNKYSRRGGGYYIDVGASQLIIDGGIKLRSGVGIKRLKESSVVLTDGSELEADLVVLATGFTNMNSWVAKLISKEVAEKVGRCWGLGSGLDGDPGPWEGELRNMWKPTRQEGLWFHGGALLQARLHSIHIALQIKARMEGIPTPVYSI